MKCKKCKKQFDRLYQGEYEDFGLKNICNKCMLKFKFNKETRRWA